MSRHTRKRLYIAAGAVLILAAVIAVVALPRDDAPLQLTFDRYAMASDGSARMAVLTLSNLSSHTYQIFLAGSPPPDFPGYYVARYAYADQVGGSWTNWTDTPSGSHAITIAPSSMAMLGVPLTSSVDVRRAGVWCFRLPSAASASGPVARITAFVMQATARWRRAPFYQAWCPTDLSWREAGLLTGSHEQAAADNAQPVDAE